MGAGGRHEPNPSQKANFCTLQILAKGGLPAAGEDQAGKYLQIHVSHALLHKLNCLSHALRLLLEAVQLAHSLHVQHLYTPASLALCSSETLGSCAAYPNSVQ